MSAPPKAVERGNRLQAAQRALADRPVLVLCGLLILLIAATDLVSPGYVTLHQLSTSLLSAAPLGVLAAGQTLVMLTGGIDLSVANTATVAAYAVGDNPLACRLAGVRVWQVLLATYSLCGLLSAVSGILLVGYTNAADPAIGIPYLLPSVAAVVIGGTSILGGSGGYAGTILGALILTVLDSLLTILNASAAVKQMLYGAIILALAWLYARTSSSE